MLSTLLKAHWRLKLLLTAVLNGIFWLGYAPLGHHAFFPLRTVPLTALDRAIPFQPEPWAWIYLSQFIFVGALPWLLTERAAIVRYAVGLLILSLTSFGIFFLFPTMGPRPLEVGDSIPMRAIALGDGPLNAFPSLHAGFLIYMSRLAWRMFGTTAPRRTLLITVVWGAAIGYSTLATKQHYALDLVAGAAIGGLADWLAWRRSPSVSAVTTIPRSSGSTSHTGIK